MVATELGIAADGLELQVGDTPDIAVVDEVEAGIGLAGRNALIVGETPEGHLGQALPAVLVLLVVKRDGIALQLGAIQDVDAVHQRV
ncbi:hypothetical protein [Mesorhizobium sp. RMAD-H1]|uniref:hypothetical protein n=1 Tax=Mesorhizobium sp. RMAD-H1 TaxID=2587065 RepID=UPI001FEF35FB|nr:hypothetical protein [Mesorhizobium sp. RMAD-H1]